jgi:hypothetical protein
MKKLFLLLLATALGMGAAFAQELKLSGEVKTGIYWKEFQNAGQPVDSNTLMHSMDDAGDETKSGRIRLNFDYDNGNGFGLRMRYQVEQLDSDTGVFPVVYAFGYGNFFEDQMTVAIGKLGASPWDTGGPEMWKQLENNNFAGMRIEWKPGFLPEGHKLNAGFVLNWFNDPQEAAGDTLAGRQTLVNILGESVIGVSYTWDEYFLARLAYRLDSAVDQKDRGILPEDTEGGEMVYRVEEYMIRKYLPGFSVWALGHLQGVGSNRDDLRLSRNWLFVQFAPEMFTAQLRFGYEAMESRSRFYVKPSFYWNFFSKLLSVGASFQYAQDFGDGKIWPGSPFEFIEVEPKVQLNFSSSYIAFVYNYRREYINPNYPDRRDLEPIRQTQRMNLRFCIYY